MVRQFLSHLLLSFELRIDLDMVKADFFLDGHSIAYQVCSTKARRIDININDYIFIRVDIVFVVVVSCLGISLNDFYYYHPSILSSS